MLIITLWAAIVITYSTASQYKGMCTVCDKHEKRAPKDPFSIVLFVFVTFMPPSDAFLSW